MASLEAASKTPWIVPIRRRGARLNLFCLPYAGGNSSIYRTWNSEALRHADVYAIELPGRGRRIAEPPIGDMTSLVDALFEAIAPALETPYLLFGHSMGGYIAHELARACSGTRARMPEQLIISAAYPAYGRERPHRPRGEDDATILRRLTRMGGTPPEILANQALMRLLMPALRADFSLASSPRAARTGTLDCPLTALSGRDDLACPPAEVARWKAATSGRFAHHQLEGGHFFLRDCEAEVLAIVGAITTGAAAALAGPLVSG